MSDSHTQNRPLETYVWQLAKALLAFLSVLVYSRYLGASGRGSLSVYLLYVQALLMMHELFVGSALANWIASYGLRRFLPRIAIMSSILLTSVLILTHLTGWNTRQDSPYIPILLISWTALLMLQNVALNFFQSKGAVLEKIQWLLSFEALKIFGLIGLVTAILPLPFLPLLNVLLVLNMAGWVWIVWIGIRMMRLHAFEKKEQLENIQHTWNEGIWAQLGQIMLFLIYRMPVFLAPYFIDNAAAGILANALLVIDTVWIFANTLGSILHGRALQQIPTFRKEKLCKRYEALSLSVTLCLSIPLIFLPGGVYASIFGSDFYAMAQVLRIAIPGILALSFFAPLGNFFHASNQFKKLFLHHTLRLFIYLLVLLILIPTQNAITLEILIWPWNFSLLGVMILHAIRRKFEFKNHPNFTFNLLLTWRLIRSKLRKCSSR